MKNLLKRMWQEEEGQDLTEYGLLMVLLALAGIAGINALATGISTAFSEAGANLTSAAS